MDSLHKLLSNYLTKDTIKIIGGMLNDFDLDVLHHTFDSEFYLVHLYDDCLENGYLNLLYYIFGYNISFNESDFRTVAKSGNLNMFDHLFNCDCLINKYVVYGAIMYDHVNILEYSYEKGFNDPYILTVAIECGSIKCVKYLNQIGYKFDKYSYISAIIHGNLDLLKYIHQTDCIITKFDLTIAIEYRNLIILEYLLNNISFDLTSDFITDATCTDDIDIIILLRKYNAPIGKYALNVAIKRDNIHIIKFLHQNGCIINDEDIELAKEINIPEIVEYLVNNK
jgi:hypothetical protein